MSDGPSDTYHGVLLHSAAGHLTHGAAGHHPLLLLLAVSIAVLLEPLQESLVEDARHVLVQLLRCSRQ
jgi:hypothetical protein